MARAVVAAPPLDLLLSHGNPSVVAHCQLDALRFGEGHRVRAGQKHLNLKQGPTLESDVELVSNVKFL